MTRSSFFSKNIQEIQSSYGLRLYGSFLTLTHVWTFLYWNRTGAFARILSVDNPSQLCFPFFPNCNVFHVFPSSVLQGLLYSYLVWALITFVLFLRPSQPSVDEASPLKWAYLSFLGLFLFKSFFYLQYYGFMGNYHYMANIVTLIFLFAPQKKALSKIAIVGFYLAAGFLKINMEWLSGAAMFHEPFIVGDLLVASLFYVILLELIMVWGLLSSRLWIRAFVLFQFIAFHIFSWHIVGFFYPCMMTSMLSVFFIEEWAQRKNQAPVTSFQSYTWPRAHILLISIFVLMQLFPHFWAKDPALSGSFRIPSLNMFDANTRCKPLIHLETQEGSYHIRRDHLNLGTRIKCDPIVFLNQVRTLCEKNKKRKEFEKLNFSLVSRRLTDQNFHPILFLPDACNQPHLFLSEFTRWGIFRD